MTEWQQKEGEDMGTEEQARALGALQHLMYATRKDLDDADSSGVYQAEIELEGFIREQPVPEGWVVEKDDTGRFLLYSPDGGFAVVGKPGEQTPTLGVVYEFLAAMLEAAPKPGADDDRGEK